MNERILKKQNNGKKKKKKIVKKDLTTLVNQMQEGNLSKKRDFKMVTGQKSKTKKKNK